MTAVTDEMLEAPTTPGWYRYNGGAQVMIFLLDIHGQWYAFFDNGDGGKCVWGYIEQALGVFDLELIVPLGGAA